MVDEYSRAERTGLEALLGAVAEVPRRGVRPLTTDSLGRFLSRSLRLSNNRISDIADLHYVIGHLMAHPSHLGWLDLSFNQITYIDPVLCELRELRVLYLHGNNIMEVSTVDKLGELQHLHTITLHGNAIENTQAYRSHVIFALPHLKTMDFSVVTREEQELAKFWHRSMKQNQKHKAASPATATSPLK